MHQWSLLSKPLVPIHQVSLFSMALEALIVDDFIPFPIKFSPITLAAPPSHLPDALAIICFKVETLNQPEIDQMFLGDLT